MVKCRMGEEKSTVLLLMRKAIAYSNTNDPLQIRTVIAPEGIKGYIYIEAFKQTHVKQVSLVYCRFRATIESIIISSYVEA